MLPPATAFANPAVGVAVLTVAAAGFEELQVTVPVRFCVLLSLKVPVAMNCSVVPTAIDGFPGVTTIETRAGTTVRLEDPLIEPRLAVTAHAPPLFPAVTSPPEATVQMLGVEDDHWADAVRSCVLLSLYVPTAFIC